MPIRKPLNSVLVKPAGPDCNLACAYCFYLQKSALFENSVHRMPDEVLKEMVKQAMQSGGDQISFGWQGGEPTLMGIEFFDRAVQYQQRFGRPGQVVGNGLQTNGILIDSEWADFLHNRRFLVGLSLDGPRHVHDKYRRTKNDKSCWDSVVRARDIMLERDVEVNALVVVNDYSVHYAEEIYQYHKENGLHFMQFIPCVEPDPIDKNRAAPFSVDGALFGKFLCKIFDLWTGDFRYGQPTTSVRFFDSVFYSYVDMQPPECTLLEECGIYVVVEHNGNVYSCDFFVDPDWLLGNVLQDQLPNLLNSSKQNAFGRIKSTLPEICKSCKWLPYCRGGCPKDRISDPGDKGENHFCQAYKMFFEHADEKLRALARKWKSEQGINQSHQAKAGRNDPCPCGSGRKYKNCCGSV